MPGAVRYKTLLFLLMLTCFVPSVLAQQFDIAGKSKRVYVPFKIVRSMVVLQLKINGKAYLLDTLNETTFVVKQQLHFRDIVKGEEYMLFYNKINLTSYES